MRLTKTGAPMPRPRRRVCLEEGLKLDLNKFIHQGCFGPRANEGCLIQWTKSSTGQQIASGLIIANTESKHDGWLHIVMPLNLEQRIELVAQPRHFGGQQWYCTCPVTHRRCTVLWRPIGASRFCSRQAFGPQVAYTSQFETPADRARRGQDKIKIRLLANPAERSLPGKPKWMRHRTYARFVEKFDSYQAVRDQHLLVASARLRARLDN